MTRQFAVLRPVRHFAAAVLLVASGSSFAADLQWTASLTGVGPLKVGMSLPEVNQALQDQLTYTPGTQPNYPACYYLATNTAPKLYLMFEHEKLARVDIAEAGIKTDTGIAVGDTVEAVKAKYGQAVQSQVHAYDESEQYLTVMSANKKQALRFETLKGHIARFYVGDVKPVSYIEGCL